MVTSVQLGNFFSSGGKTVVGGVGGSGLDTKSLVESLTTAKRLPATQLEDKIKVNDKKSAALSEFQKLVSKLKDSMNFLRNPPGVANSADNAFAYSTTSISSDNGIAGSTYLSVTASPGALLQDYTISDITSIAKAKKQSTGNISVANADTSVVVASGPAAGQFKAGTFTLNGKSITLATGDSLNAVAAKFNAVSADTKVSASVIKVADGTFQLSFSATVTGSDADFDFNNLQVGQETTIVDASGVLSMVPISTKQDASNAVFKFNGASITRQSNSISDIVSDVTFNILQPTPLSPPAAAVTTLTVSVKPDETTAKSGIINFINAYNDIKVFAAKQNALKADGTFADDAVLANSTVLRTTMSSLNGMVSGIVSGLSSINRLADIGITSADLPETTDTPKVRNILNVDDGKLTSMLSSNFSDVRKIFEFSFSSNNPNLQVFSRTNALDTSSFTLDINPYATQTTKVLTVADADTDIVSATPTDQQFKAGNVVIAGQTISLVAGDTLNTIAGKFAAVSATTGVTATVVMTEAGKYKLQFASTSNGVNTNLLSAAVDATGVFTNTGITSSGTFKATYTTGDGPVTVDLTAKYVTDSSGNRTGISLTGQSGTALDGMVMVYAGVASGNMTVTATQGIGDKIFNTVDGTLKEDTGPLAVELDALKTSDTKLTDEIKKIDDQIEIYRQQLLDKFGALEQAIAKVNTLLQSLDAQTQARNNS